MSPALFPAAPRDRSKALALSTGISLSCGVYTPSTKLLQQQLQLQQHQQQQEQQQRIRCCRYSELALLLSIC